MFLYKVKYIYLLFCIICSIKCIKMYNMVQKYAFIPTFALKCII